MKADATTQCRKLIERLSTFVDGDLPAAQRRTVMAHLRTCPCCRRLADGLTHTSEVCRQAGHSKLPAAVRARARRRVAALLAEEQALVHRR